MKICIFFLLILIQVSGFSQEITVVNDSPTKNTTKIIYETQNPNSPESLLVKYYINEHEKKVLPLKKVNGKYEFNIKSKGEPIAVFFTIDLGLLTKFDDNFKKGYCVLINVKNTEDSIKAQLSKLKYSRKYFYFLNTNPTPFADYGKEIESIKDKITPEEFEYFKLDYLNYKYSLNPKKYKQELLEYISTLSSEKDEDLQGYICAIYGNILGDSVRKECTNQIKLKIQDSDINASFFTDSLENSNQVLKKKYIFEKIEEFEKCFPSHPDYLFYVYKNYLGNEIRNHNLEEVVTLVSKVKLDKITLAKGICEFSKSDYLNTKNKENYYEVLTKIAIGIIETNQYNDSLLSRKKYENVVFCYSTYAYFLSIAKKYQEAFIFIQKALEFKPNDRILIETSAEYGKNAFGDLFAKEYIENLIGKNGSSKELLLQLKEIYQNLNLPESEIRNIELISDSKKNDLTKSAILMNYGAILAPNFQLSDINNKLGKLSDYHGKRVFVYYWALWCGPCRASMPHLMKLKEKYKDVNFILIDTWENNKEVKDEVKSFLNKNKYTFDVYLDPKYNAANMYKIEALPTKFLIDQNGNFELLNPSLSELDIYLSQKY